MWYGALGATVQSLEWAWMAQSTNLPSIIPTRANTTPSPTYSAGIFCTSTGGVYLLAKGDLILDSCLSLNTSSISRRFSFRNELSSSRSS